MRKFYYFITLLVISCIIYVFMVPKEAHQPSRKVSKAQRIEGAIEYMKFTSSDVDLGYIPQDKLMKAMKEAQVRIDRPSRSRTMDGSLVEAIWRERGPNNIGGRTRAIMIDASDPNRNRIWAGSVSGGLWRTEDITQPDPQWEKLATELDNLAIGSIAQDPNNHDIIYVGTGEGFPNIDAVNGAGIFKSIDDGMTWTWLASTKNVNFERVHEVYVHTNGDIYAGTHGTDSSGGLYRSKDGGNTWEKVLGSGLSGATSNTFYDFIYIEANQTLYASSANSIFKSTTGNRGEWINVGVGKPGFPTNLVRCEMAVCAENPDVMYVIGSIDGAASSTFVSNNGGDNWTSRQSPGDFPGDDFTNGQAWYDLDIAVDPFNCGRIVAGGVPLYMSPFQGISWQQIADGVHVDQHYILFDTKKQNRLFYGNDGGIWLSENGGLNAVSKNFGFVTTQFYAGAIHPEAGSPYLLGGTQDNNSLQITEPGLAPANSVRGGDGVYCFIDQNDPNIQIVSRQYGDYGISFDGGMDFDNGVAVNGDFINRSGYDDDANILYGQVNGSDFFRWEINTGILTNVDISGLAIGVSAVKADPHVPNRIYFGSETGRIVRVENAHEGSPVQGTVIGTFPGGAPISSIYLDRQDPDHIVVGLYRFGSSLENIYVTYNGGAEWTSIEGDLPDMPVRWALFDPSNHDRVMIATEAGVWVTDDVNGNQTHWEPIAPANGMPFVKVDMLVMRESDKTVLAATHGRGLFTTDVFSAPTPVILSQPIAYAGQPVMIDGSQSVNAQDYHWDLGDNNTSQEPVLNHVYDSPGTYNITLTINGSVSKTNTIAVLPYLPAPYQPGIVEYGGDFETLPDHFASYLVQGTGFSRGNSTKPGKDGTHSGTSAWVLGINDNLYLNNTRAELYTPMYDLSEQGLYEFKFWGKHAVQSPRDGYQVEYSLDGGASWLQLGSSSNPNWYNYHNANITDGAFPQGKSYFTSAQLNWTNYVKDISFLAGEPAVSFRFVFRSDNAEQAQGLAIDDVEITKFDGELKTIVTIFNGGYTGGQEVTINWTTGIEYQCQQFILERSYDGFNFENIANGVIPAKGVVSASVHSYSKTDPNSHDIIYYRLNVINENPDIPYSLEFYADTIVVRKEDAPKKVNEVLPNPFSNMIGMSFNDVIDLPIVVRLFDVAGRLVVEEQTIPHSTYYQLDRLNLPSGVYILSVQIGDSDPEVFKLRTALY